LVWGWTLYQYDVANMSFSELLRKDVAPVWNAIFKHAFIVEMSEGVLPLDKFKFFIMQDYVFLIEFSRGLAVAASKAHEIEDLQRFIEFLHATTTIEVGSLRRLANELGIATEELEKVHPTPTTYAYTRHILSVAHCGSFGEFVAAILPCMWSYQELGERIRDSKKLQQHPVYSKWTVTYRSKEYKELVNWLRSLIDRLARDASRPERSRMREHFVIGSRYEYMFWDMAYKLEMWPV